MSELPPLDPDQTATFLRRFQVSRDASAFQEIVRHYGGLVEGTAGRILHGDTEAARDVAQRVFVDLAQAAPGLAADSQLGGWLHRHTVFVALHHCQADQRRRRREREAAFRMEMETGGPSMEDDRTAAVHAALAKLPEDDRTVLVLRYWENRPLKEVGAILGVGGDAAQKRVSRALDRLRARLSRRGTAASAAILAQRLTSSVTAQAGLPAWTSAVTRAALAPAMPAAAPGFFTLSSSWKAGLLGAGAAAAVISLSPCRGF